MNLYCATVDYFVTYRPGKGKPMRVRRTFLMESENIHRVATEAIKIAEANAPFGPLLVGMEFVLAHRVTLPAAIDFEKNTTRRRVTFQKVHSQGGNR